MRMKATFFILTRGVGVTGLRRAGRGRHRGGDRRSSTSSTPAISTLSPPRITTGRSSSTNSRRTCGAGRGRSRNGARIMKRTPQARGISAGRVDYGKPLAANSDGTSAYIVLPTTYRFQQKGRKMAGKGSMTFVMKGAGSAGKSPAGPIRAPSRRPSKPLGGDDRLRPGGRWRRRASRPSPCRRP